MTDERWQEIVAHIKDHFAITDHRTEDIPEEEGRGVREVIEFTGPLGNMRLERTTQPLLLDKRTIGSKRIGSQTTIEYIYSDTEKVHKFIVYRFDEKAGEWEEMKMDRGQMLF